MHSHKLTERGQRRREEREETTGKKGDKPVNDQGPASPAEVDSTLENLGRTCRLNDDVESVRVVPFNLFQLLRGRVGAAGQLNVRIGRVELLGELHLRASGRGEGEVGGAVLAEELS